MNTSQPMRTFEAMLAAQGANLDAFKRKLQLRFTRHHRP